MRIQRYFPSLVCMSFATTLATTVFAEGDLIEKSSFQIYKTNEAVGQKFVHEAARCAFYSCFWRSAKVLKDIKDQLIALGHVNQDAGYPWIDTDNLTPWVVRENGVQIDLLVGEIISVEVENFIKTDLASCPFEAQLIYKISNFGAPNPLADITRKAFEKDNTEATGDEVFVTMRECFKLEDGTWQQTKWGYFLRS